MLYHLAVYAACTPNKYIVMFQIIAAFCLVIIMYVFTGLVDHKEHEDEWM